MVAHGELRAGSGGCFDTIDAPRRCIVGDDLATGAVSIIGFSLGGGYALAVARRGGFAGNS